MLKVRKEQNIMMKVSHGKGSDGKKKKERERREFIAIS